MRQDIKRQRETRLSHYSYESIINGLKRNGLYLNNTEPRRSILTNVKKELVSKMLAKTDYVNQPAPELASKSGKKGAGVAHTGWATTCVNRCFSFVPVLVVLGGLRVNPHIFKVVLKSSVSKMLAKWPIGCARLGMRDGH